MAFFETLKYDAIKKDGPIEIRRYDSFLLASTKTRKNSSQDSGFRNVFNYISGNNEQDKKLSMTTPVVTYEEKESLVTGFYISKKYTNDTVPKPSSSEVFIHELKPSLYAVIRFRGQWTNKNFDKHDKMLREYLNTHDYEVQSSRLIMRYQPPFMPGIFRRNEIAYQINDGAFEPSK
jgi:hypothetical protein